MNERYLTSFEDQTTALGYTSGDTTLVSPQVSLVGANEVVYSKEIPNGSRIRFAKNETTGRLYFIVDGGGVYYDALTLKKTEIPVITYGEVDLGLPSGIKWADRNVGAETPQDYGAYFSWGSTSGVSINGTDKRLEDDIIRIILSELGDVPAETITQELIDNIKLEGGEDLKMEIEGFLTEYSLISGTTFGWETVPYYSGVDDNDIPLFSKYNKTDGLTMLEAIDDAATSNMSSDWRMPTYDEAVELVRNTDHYYISEEGSIVAGPFNYETNTKDKGLDGSKLRSVCFVKKGKAFDYDNRSNFIEFPFTGSCSGSLLESKDFSGCIITNSVFINGEVELGALYLDFSSDGYLNNGNGFNATPRYYGRSVRGVHA